MFEFSSRYASIENATFTDSTGRTTIYKRRRFLPQLNTMTILAEVSITGGDRLDLIAARVFGASEQFWLLCDANHFLMNPFALAEAEIGRKVRVPGLQFQAGASLPLGASR